ncbi:MAG: cytochrome P450 [Acidobacteria bacterium]|nr:cytochrome P450 [Acidobacteriota bacterium]
MGLDIPAHVPPDRVVDVDLYRMPGSEQDLHAPWKALQDTAAGGVVWTPHNGGHWIVTGGSDIARIYADHENFSSNITIVPREFGEQFPLRPTTVDPPGHRRFRQRINAALTPAVVRTVEPTIRRVIIESVERIRPAGCCEFISECAVTLPIAVFMHLADLPLESAAVLPGYSEDPNSEGPHAGVPVMERFAAFLRPWVAERRAHPGDDLISCLLTHTTGDASLTDDEAVDVGVALLTGGLDTVVSSLGFMMAFLARNPDHRRRLVADPSLIRAAVAEMLRRFPIMTKGRLVRRDQVMDSVCMKAGDMVILPPLHGLDEREFHDPLTVDFHRPVAPHSTFGNGVHRCPGAHLSQIETEIVLREWIARIPEFEIDPVRPPTMRSGILGAMLQVGLRWDPHTTIVVPVA